MLGFGSFGRTFLGEDIKKKKKVAIKIVSFLRKRIGNKHNNLINRQIHLFTLQIFAKYFYKYINIYEFDRSNKNLILLNNI